MGKLFPSRSTAQLDVAVIDIVLPERAGERANFEQHVGIQVARQLRERLPSLGIVFLSAYVDRGPEVIQLFMEGHDRIVYLLKGSKPQELLEAIRKVAGGLSALEIAAGVQAVRRTVFDLALRMLSSEEQACVKLALENLAALSEPERRVFETLGACRTRQQAANELGLATKTVDSHMDAIYNKLYLREGVCGLSLLMLLAKIHLLHGLRGAEKNGQL
jgi:two-component system response regulator DevR